jgi:hypothetical protein
MKQLICVSRGLLVACVLVLSACAQTDSEKSPSADAAVSSTNNVPLLNSATLIDQTRETMINSAAPNKVENAATSSELVTRGTQGQPLSLAPKANVCVIRDVGPSGTNGNRYGFFFEAINEAVVGSEVISNCVKLVNTQGISSMATTRGSMISVNQGPWQSTSVSITEGDSVRLKTVAQAEPDSLLQENIVFNNTIYLAEFHVRTANNGRAPKIFKVGENRTFKQVNEVVSQLSAGDVVEVDPGIYQPFEIARSGMKNAPITIRGVGASRPVFAGGDFTVSFRGAHSVALENVEVTGGKLVCVRTEGDNLVIRDVFIHDCLGHGVLGTDVGNGTNVIERTEVTRAGAQIVGRPTEHAIYIATDRDQFPQAVLRVQHSYIHNFRGAGIKSRSNRNEIYYNWIESKVDPHSLYALELAGYEEFFHHGALNSDVVGNVMVPNSGYFSRFGGDGAGSSRGRYRFANNTVVFPDTAFGQNTSAFRFFGELESVYLQNNAFVRSNGTGGLFERFFYDLTTEYGRWMNGTVQIGGANNYFPIGTNLKLANPFDLVGSLFANNGFTDLRLTSLNVTPAQGSMLLGAAKSNLVVPEAFNIGGTPLEVLRFKAPATRPVSGQYLLSIPRAANEPVSVGAI